MSTPIIDKNHPATVRIKGRALLAKLGSSKKTYHISLDLEDSGVDFKPGDSIGVYAQNDPIWVEHLLKALHAKGDEIIIDARSEKAMTIREFLSFKANLTRLNSSLLKDVYTFEMNHDKKNQLHRLLQEENKVLLTQYLQSHDPLDFFKEYAEAHFPLQQICSHFAPLLPRFYSVASSLKQLPNEVHLAVALTSYQHGEHLRYGVASHFLCHLAEIHKTHVPIYVQHAPHFALPEDPDAALIMIGPGTGIAPYRAFLQDREATGAKGKNWLFFGERNRQFDYFYEDEITKWADQKMLRLDLAFSRDQEEKLYVQHKLYEQRHDLWQWIQDGAYLYLCGDAQHMAKDVDAMLQKIAQEVGSLTPEDAKAFFKKMRKEKRYLQDIY